MLACRRRDGNCFALKDPSRLQRVEREMGLGGLRGRDVCVSVCVCEKGRVI